MLTVRTGVIDSSFEWHMGEAWPTVAVRRSRRQIARLVVRADGDELNLAWELGLLRAQSREPAVAWRGAEALYVLDRLGMSAAAARDGSPSAEPDASWRDRLLRRAVPLEERLVSAVLEAVRAADLTYQHTTGLLTDRERAAQASLIRNLETALREELGRPELNLEPWRRR